MRKSSYLSLVASCGHGRGFSTGVNRESRFRASVTRGCRRVRAPRVGVAEGLLELVPQLEAQSIGEFVCGEIFELGEATIPQVERLAGLRQRRPGRAACEYDSSCYSGLLVYWPYTVTRYRNSSFDRSGACGTTPNGGSTTRGRYHSVQLAWGSGVRFMGGENTSTCWSPTRTTIARFPDR